MSRLIVKNLPSGMKEDRFRKLFAAFGTLTDCSLKFTRDGKFRKFGFIGFKSEDEAKMAMNHFNKSFIDMARITVEFCKSFGDPSKPRAWSKHSRKPSAPEKLTDKPKTSPAPTETKKDKKKKNTTGNLKEAFREFLVVHQKRTQVATWANDTLAEEPKTGKSKPTDDYLNFDSDESEEFSEEEEGRGKPHEESKAAARTELSDMDYLKSKVVKDSSSSSSEEESEEDQLDSGQHEGGSEDEKEPSSLETIGFCRVYSAFVTFTKVGPRNLSDLLKFLFSSLQQNVREFLLPLKPVAIRIARNVHGNKTGYVFVDFNGEEEVQKALKRNREYMGGRYIEVFREESGLKMKLTRKGEDQPWQRRKKADEEEEDLSESGRLFVRNLPYTSTEEDLEQIFSKYGPLSEIHFPIDSLTKKPKGFAFITYMIPEHAVKAFAEVDGQVFQGRMLHVLPSTIKKEEGENLNAEGSSSYKKQKESKDKANSASSHNWNTLFMGTNAVADAIAQKYNATKSQVLDDEGKGSVAVRVALGETQLVQDVRQFLIDNGVSLDSFSQAAGERSKTVILVKNLPAGTKVVELEEVFGPHGSLGRVLLPEGGITAIVEFLEPTEAKRAFTKLAYSKFQHVPLYLEWAPMGVFSCPPPEKKQPEIPGEEGERIPQETRQSHGTKKGSEDIAVEEEEEEESVPGCTLFIKNLNFATTEDTLKETFSKVGALKSCTISRKIDKAGTLLPMGFGFVEYKKPEHAQKALRQLQVTMGDAGKGEEPTVTPSRKKQTLKKQKSSKILVRNIPFQATVREIRELFSTFGELKTVRLPKKMAGTGSHRGFGFVDFLTKQDAKKAFNALCHSTHLYGRRLVLEWADTEETVETLRRKTAEHFHGNVVASRQMINTSETSVSLSGMGQTSSFPGAVCSHGLVNGWWNLGT
uniref:Probable RNA-binding protein 19 n=1 Tax=Chelonoidis abingdonii TaxID=106734 RepID=A0A8C0GE03_CHEAB